MKYKLELIGGRNINIFRYAGDINQMAESQEELNRLLMKMMLTPWKESYDQPRQHIEKQRHCFVNKGLSSQGYGFSNSYVWM